MSVNITSTASITETMVISNWVPLLTWQNIVVQYESWYAEGYKFINNVQILDSYYTGIYSGTHIHDYGDFRGVATMYPTIMGMHGGTAYAYGRDYQGVDIYGMVIGIATPVTFSISFIG